jgi:uncharacterized protein (TIGR00106 family)
MHGIVEFTIIPIGTGSTSVSKYVKYVHEILETRDFIVEPNSMGTVVEGEIKDILDVILEINKKLSGKELKRIVTTIKIDYRTDKKTTIKSKLESIK